MEYSKEIIKIKLSTDIRWIEKAIISIYYRQTESEQSNKFTSEKNGVGFCSYDANYFSYLANYLLKNKNNHLSGEHLIKAKKSIPKYWKQILNEIKS
jgi:hypothetical protein